MEDASDEVIKQICVQTEGEKQMKLLCLVNKRFSNLYSNKYFMEAVYSQKCENRFGQKISDFKDRNKKWKCFYDYVLFLKLNPYLVNGLCQTGDLLNIKLYANMTPPILPNSVDIYHAACNGYLDVLKYCVEAIGIHNGSEAAYWAACNGHLDVLKYLMESLKIEIYYDPQAAYWADMNGHKDVVNYLASLNPV